MASLLQHVKEAITHKGGRHIVEPGIDPEVAQEAPNVPEKLYHTLLTVVEPHEVHPNPAGGPVERSTYPLGTHATRDLAIRFASTALRSLGYEPDDFQTYEVRPADLTAPSDHPWSHGDDTVVYARTPVGQEFVVKVVERHNPEHIMVQPDGSGEVRFPDGSPHLSYVLVTESDLRRESETTTVEGCFYHRADALDHARSVLLAGGTKGKKTHFAEYDERESLDDASAKDWPFGEEVVVHAVGTKGENFKVAIKTVPGTHEKHAKEHAKGAK